MEPNQQKEANQQKRKPSTKMKTIYQLWENICKWCDWQ